MGELLDMLVSGRVSHKKTLAIKQTTHTYLRPQGPSHKVEKARFSGRTGP